MFYKCCDGCRKLLNKLKKYGTISLEIWIYENMILYLICDGFRHISQLLQKGADMIYTIEQIKDKCRKVFEKQNFVKEAYLFGSYARGEATENSDIDFMIVLNRAVGMEFFGLYYFLQEEFGKNVDIISEKEAYEIMPKSIERDKVKVYGNE